MKIIGDKYVAIDKGVMLEIGKLEKSSILVFMEVLERMEVNKEEFDFNVKNVSKKLNISLRSTYRAIKDLTDRNYIKKVRIGVYRANPDKLFCSIEEVEV